MMPYIYFALIVFILLGVVQIFRSLKQDKEDEYLCDCGANHSVEGSPIKSFLIYALFVLPLLTGFMFPDKVLDSAVAEKKGITYGSGIQMQQSDGQKNTDEKETTSESNTSKADQFLENPDEYMENLEAETGLSNSEDQPSTDKSSEEQSYLIVDVSAFYEKLANQLKDEEKIIVTPENYLDIMSILDLYVNQFVGKQLELVGFVFRERDFSENQFVVARFAIQCCSADATVYGTLAEWSKAKKLETDSWVRVTGRIDRTEYGSQNIPLLQIEDVQQIEEPDEPYVYPSTEYLNQ
jgi:putative membrane protein